MTSRGKVQKQLQHKKFDDHEGYERVYIIEQKKETEEDMKQEANS